MLQVQYILAIVLLCCQFCISSTTSGHSNYIHYHDTTSHASIEDLSSAFTIFDSESQNNNTNSSSALPELKNMRAARIIALNKMTAKSEVIDLSVGESKYFGNIEITLHKCFKSLDLYHPDNSALLTIYESKIDEESILIFQGWMFSSNIAISTMTHPIYEIFIKQCL